MIKQFGRRRDTNVGRDGGQHFGHKHFQAPVHETDHLFSTKTKDEISVK